VTPPRAKIRLQLSLSEDDWMARVWLRGVARINFALRTRPGSRPLSKSQSRRLEKTSEADRETDLKAASLRYFPYWLRRTFSWIKSYAAPVRIRRRGKLQSPSGFQLDMEASSSDVACRPTPACLTRDILGLLCRRCAALE
jgi:hypothetical protein